MSIAEIKEMSTAERLRTMEALWDALCHEAVEPEAPLWHEKLLIERKNKMQSGEAHFMTIEEARKRLLK